MKAIPSSLFLALSLMATLPQAARAAVTFSITPATVSNTYGGQITLQIAGLANKDTVVVQKFLDRNANGVIDNADGLVQQFNLTDGQAGMMVGGVTNLNVPGDVNVTAGAITAALNFQNGDFLQRVTANYLFKLSSPAGRFKPLTNPFAVTSFPFPQEITGHVVNQNTGVAVPHAVVILLRPPPPGENGPGSPLGGVTANQAGRYSAPLPPGNYRVMVLGANHVYALSQSPGLTLLESQTLTTNLSLLPATSSISGKLRDAGDSGISLPGVWVFGFSSEGFLSIAFADSNGLFSLPVIPGPWAFDTYYAAAGLHGYVGWYDSPFYNADAGATGLTLAYPKANALFYGRVRDGQGNPMPGVRVACEDRNEEYYSESYTDKNGDYALGALGGLNNDPWEVHIDTDSSPTNYVFSYSTLGDTPLIPGQTVRQDFIALPAPHTISGSLKDNHGNPIRGVGIWANATINGVFYHVYSVKTDAEGHYAFNVSHGDWDVGGFVNLPDTYFRPEDRTITISGQSAVVDFVANLVTDPQPGLAVPARPSNGQFEFLLSGVAGQNYTVQMSTNLSSGLWTALFTTNSETASQFLVIDPKATNQQRFYRVLVGP